MTNTNLDRPLTRVERELAGRFSSQAVNREHRRCVVRWCRRHGSSVLHRWELGLWTPVVAVVDDLGYPAPAQKQQRVG